MSFCISKSSIIALCKNPFLPIGSGGDYAQGDGHPESRRVYSQ